MATAIDKKTASITGANAKLDKIRKERLTNGIKLPSTTDEATDVRVPAAQKTVVTEITSKGANAVSDSLIPIKGISKKLQSSLSKLGVFDIPSLLARCRTRTRRNNLAAKLGIDAKYVNSWVKQADLWRVDGMDTDLAYLLVQAGVRGVEDLAKVDSDKIYPILKCLSEAQPDFELMAKSAFAKVQESAREIIEIASSSKTRIFSDYGFDSTGIESMYAEEVEDEPAEVRKLAAAWKDLFEFDCTLPLPRFVSGTVMQSSVTADTKPSALSGVKVEMDGLASPTADNLEGPSYPCCITDVTGHFIITLPEKYSFKETVRLIISNKYGKQEFVLNSSDIINSIEEASLVDALQEVLSKRIISRRDSSLLSDFISSVEALVKGEHATTLKALSLSAKVESLKNIPLIGDDDIFDTAMDTIFRSILKKSTLEAKLKGANRIDGQDYFLVTTELFTGDRTDLKKALPSVKLMGEDDNSTMLSTDTAPSKMYSYSMLQRLIEPVVKKKSGLTGDWVENERTEVNSPIDVAAFKDSMSKDPDGYAQMSSLGLGYQLNMHQAWVPDGFALGDLLYSLILAPGEEQRLIVREKKQSYELTDTSEGTDNVDESYQASQTDDTSAVYNYAVQQLMKGESSYETESDSWGAGGSGGGFLGGIGSGIFGGASLGLSGSYSKSSANGSSSASQNNSHNEASSAAQQFQQSIKSASNKLSQARRMSISVASSDVSDSVATKIIANHNHSHAMTIQYWEVMRRYKLETAVDSVDLVLFIPLKAIKFLPRENEFTLNLDNGNANVPAFSKSAFDSRYAEILKHVNALESALPYKYRTGLNLIRQYSALPDWEYEKLSGTSQVLILTFTSDMMTFDHFTAVIVLKNGKGRISGTVNTLGVRNISAYNYTSEGLKTKIRNRDATPQMPDWAEGILNDDQAVSVTCTFTLPSGIIPEDIESIRIGHTCDSFSYELYKFENLLTDNQKTAWHNYLGKEEDFAKDNDDSSGDIKSMSHYKELLPEAFKSPKLTFTASQMQALGAPSMESLQIFFGGENITCFSNSSVISSEARVTVSVNRKTLRRSELQKMEETFQHIVTNGLLYSQVVWASLSSDERAMLFDQYTISMDYTKLRACGTRKDADSENIPLLNCVNVRKLLGFYGNCMLLPFTFPQELEEKLGRSAADVQDQIYRFHTNSFRAPTTIISMPTSGMIGEAVLGQTNVSEVIDLTRFWNWQDSPIDKMTIDKDYLDNKDYLENKKTQQISALNLSSASAPTAVDIPQLINTLAAKQTPTFNDMTGKEQLATLIGSALESSSGGRDNIVNQTTTIANKALDLVQKQQAAETEAQNKLDIEKLKLEHPESAQAGEGQSTESGTPKAQSGETPKAKNSETPKAKNSEGGKQNGKTSDAGNSESGKLVGLLAEVKEYFETADSPNREEFLTQFYNIFGGNQAKADKRTADEFVKKAAEQLSGDTKLTLDDSITEIQ